MRFSPLTRIETRYVKQALADAIERRGYTTLTPVQEAVTNPDLTGADLLVSAQTGSGKTLGFGLAIAPTLLGDADAFGAATSPLALVIAPTRELALQVKRELDWLYAGANAHVTSCVGGMDMRDERRALARGTHIVVATPGRLRDHIMRGSIDLGALRAVVLDEADEMLDLGFREDLEFILGEAPETRQTLLFSATVPAAIAKLAQSYQRDAVRVSTTAEKSPHADIEYRALSVSSRDGETAIINVLRYYEAPNAIVFCNTRAMVNRLTTRLSNRGFSVVALSGELSQSERTHALQAMRDGRARVCVATDVAARGIDLPNLDLVVHAELPTGHETLLHRSGRTGRAGRKGVSVLIVPPAARKKAQRILGWAKLHAEWSDAPSADAVIARDEERMLGDSAWHDPVPDAQSATIAKLTDSFTAEQIAAAYLRLYHERHTAPEDLSDPGEKPQPRAEFGPSTWFSLQGGRAAGAEPRRILPMLCKAGDITKDDIGAIRIQPDVTLFQIRQPSVARFLAAIGPDMKVEDGAALTQLDAAPNLGRPDRPSGPSKPPHGKSPHGKPRAGKPPSKPHRGKPHHDAPEVSTPAPAEAPKHTTAGTTTPVDWNDSSVSRRKKPKAAATTGKSHKLRKPKPAYDPDVVSSKPAHRKPDAGAPGRGNDSDRKPKGGKPPFGKPASGKPPAGKPSSKKNRARAAAKTMAAKSGKGGNAAPYRGKK